MFRVESGYKWNSD